MEPESKNVSVGAGGDKRRQRLAAALRSNLALRKARSKGGSTSGPPLSEAQTEPAEPFEEANTLWD